MLVIGKERTTLRTGWLKIGVRLRRAARGEDMKSALCALLVATIIAAAQPALAQLQCSASAEEAKTTKLADQSRDYLAGFYVGMQMALTPKTFPFDAIAKIYEPCTRGKFDAAEGTYEIFGGVGDSPPRYAIGPDPKRVAYIALGPPPAAALAWAKDRNRSNGLSFNGGGVYVLAITDGDKRAIFAVYDNVPGDTQLLAAFRDALDGKLAKVATFDSKTGETVFAR